jgi:hypothetical protein
MTVRKGCKRQVFGAMGEALKTVYLYTYASMARKMETSYTGISSLENRAIALIYKVVPER